MLPPFSETEKFAKMPNPDKPELNIEN